MKNMQGERGGKQKRGAGEERSGVEKKGREEE